MVMTVMGGLNTNCMMQVCDENDAPIPGLFNVGHMCGNMYANNYNFAIPGNCYGINCITFGYLLGHDLANGVFEAQALKHNASRTDEGGLRQRRGHLFVWSCLRAPG